MMYQMLKQSRFQSLIMFKPHKHIAFTIIQPAPFKLYMPTHHRHAFVQSPNRSQHNVRHTTQVGFKDDEAQQKTLYNTGEIKITKEM